jgi:hypothetical protein
MRDGEEGDLEGVDGAVVRGGELLAVGERERGGAARSGEGLEAPRAQLPVFPPPHLLQPHPPGHTRGVYALCGGERAATAFGAGRARRSCAARIGRLMRRPVSLTVAVRSFH